VSYIFNKTRHVTYLEWPNYRTAKPLYMVYRTRNQNCNSQGCVPLPKGTGTVCKFANCCKKCNYQYV